MDKEVIISVAGLALVAVLLLTLRVGGDAAPPPAPPVEPQQVSSGIAMGEQLAARVRAFRQLHGEWP